MGTKSLQAFIFSTEFEDGINRAVREAVEQSDAAGLAPAYEPAFSKLKEFRSEQKKSRDALLELCRQGLAEKAGRDQATLEFHGKVFDLLEEGGQPAGFIMRKAREIIEMWESKGLNNKYGPMWKQLLDGSPTAARDFILSDNASGWPLNLRSGSPFTHLAVYPEDRWDAGASLLAD